jgi:hypothetical protein
VMNMSRLRRARMTCIWTVMRDMLVRDTLGEHCGKDANRPNYQRIDQTPAKSRMLSIRAEDYRNEYDS